MVSAHDHREKVARVYTKVGRALVAAAAAGALVSGCGSPVQAGSAIIVGDTAVPLEQVQSQVGTLLARVPAEQRQQDTAPTLARDIVTNELLHTLLARASAEQGVTVTDAEVDAFIEQQGGAQTLLQNSVLDLEGLRSQAHDFLVATALGRKAAPGLAVTIDLIGSPNRTDAEAKARTLAAGGPAADALFNDSRTARKGVEVAAATDTQNAGSVVFGTPVGDVVAYQPDPQQATWNVFRVTDRRTDARTPGAPATLSLQQLYLIGQRTLQPLADDLAVRVNPRYGVWDQVSLRAAAQAVAGDVRAAEQAAAAEGADPHALDAEAWKRNWQA